MRQWILAAGCAIGVSLALPQAGSATSLSPCRTHPDTAATAVDVVRQDLTFADSAELAASVLPYKPSSVVAVSDTLPIYFDPLLRLQLVVGR